MSDTTKALLFYERKSTLVGHLENQGGESSVGVASLRGPVVVFCSELKSVRNSLFIKEDSTTGMIVVGYGYDPSSAVNALEPEVIAVDSRLTFEVVNLYKQQKVTALLFENIKRGRSKFPLTIKN